ncbi:PREDICTED: ABC transporter G family member 20-like [Eufriesea mexicana]|uniref:ABC transporter G family member 20-like n=1 Tax=Eufriesea mexicana TaxID=516756 RepID=UPI00083C40EF|nr:PREDICTED: ABC transporter G family member 20-like [Eufriesea mexicana]XP_017762063.1 PREDICTED: ABC transporter G family member 20-like [Eufriesea mexicana]
MVSDNAIIVRNVRKSYGSNAILNGLNMNVKRGTIYGFLGPSGSGKTTLLSCMVGVQKVDSGDIWVLGGKPGTKNSGIPGPRVGYMPQEISLVDEFSVSAAFYYFGKVNGMEDHEIEEGYMNLKDILQLPPRNRLMKDMSGGQQRRVSFGVSMLHKPELLVLDEPTVGLDPVIRNNLWCHLENLAKDGITVIITTHYIEETKQADKIGLMRSGILLAESTPNDLLERFETDSLEEAFLKLSQMQENYKPINASQVSNPCMESNELTHSNFPNQNRPQLRSSKIKRCHALLNKNLLQFVRYPGGILFSLILPIMQMVLVFNSIGMYPKGLSILVVNNEADNCNYGKYQGNVTYNRDENTCTMVDISCRFQNAIDDLIPNKIFYDSIEEAEQNAYSGNTFGILHFHRNFSDSMTNRLENSLDVSNDVITTSRINIFIYILDYPTYFYVQRELYDIFLKQYEKIMEECGASRKLGNVPILFEEPIYGSKEQTYFSFLIPTFVLAILFILATSMCASVIVTERHSGLWDRNLVQGVTTSEILITHMISQVVVVLFQVTITLCIFFLYYNVECKGSVGTIIWLAIFGGISGTTYGMTISVISNDHSLANYMSVGTFYPLVLLSGLIWPLEAMPKLLRWFSILMPLTLPGIAFRGILEKGITFNDPEVYEGFLVTIGWIFGCLGLCLVLLRLQK